MTSILDILKIKELQRKIAYTLTIIFIFRLGSHIPISGVDMNALQSLFSQGGLLGFVDLFSGGALGRFSIFALGILPYINASIIMQMLTFVMPKLKELAEEGSAGHKKIAQYTRYLTIAIALVQSIVMSIGFKSFVMPGINFGFFLFYAVVGLVAGATLVMWLGEIMTEHGIGNGASIIIFISIISQMPFYIKSTYVLLEGGASQLNVAIMVAVLLFMVLSGGT